MLRGRERMAGIRTLFEAQKCSANVVQSCIIIIVKTCYSMTLFFLFFFFFVHNLNHAYGSIN